MPRVQTYGANRESTQQISNQRAVTTSQVDTSLAPGLNNLANGLAAYQQRADETAAEESLINFEREKNKMFFDPKDGYFNKQGRDAYEGGEVMSKSLEELQNKYADQLKSPQARDAFKRASTVHVTRGFADIQKHATTGLQSYETATRKARVDNSIESATLYWNNPEEAEVQFAVGYDTITQMAKDQGLDAEATNEMLQSYDSQFSKARIEAAMSNDLTTANKMFEKFGDRIEGKDRLQVEQALQKANFDTLAVGTSDKIIATGAQTLTELMGEVDRLPSKTPEEVALKTEVQRLVTNRHSINKRMQDEQQEEVYQNYAKQIQDGLGTSKNIPASAWNTMSFTQRENIRKMEDRMSKGTARTTDERLFHDLLSMPDTELAKLDPVKYFSRLKDTDYNRLQTAVIAAKKGKTSTPDFVDITGNAGRMKNTMRMVFGKDTSKLSATELTTYNSISRAIQTQVEEATLANNGKKLSPTQLDELYNGFARKQVIDRKYWFDDTKGLNRFSAEGIEKATNLLRGVKAPINSVNIMNLIRDNPTEFGK